MGVASSLGSPAGTGDSISQALCWATRRNYAYPKCYCGVTGKALAKASWKNQKTAPERKLKVERASLMERMLLRA